MLDDNYKDLIKFFIKKAAQDIKFTVDITNIDDHDTHTSFRTSFGFQVITDTETEQSIMWRYVPVHLTFDTMGLYSSIGDNKFDAIYKFVSEKIMLQGPLVKAKSVIGLGQSLQLR